jgi:hypothetical protein
MRCEAPEVASSCRITAGVTDLLVTRLISRLALKLRPAVLSARLPFLYVAGKTREPMQTTCRLGILGANFAPNVCHEFGGEYL